MFVPPVKRETSSSVAAASEGNHGGLKRGEDAMIPSSSPKSDGRSHLGAKVGSMKEERDGEESGGRGSNSEYLCSDEWKPHVSVSPMSKYVAFYTT